MPRRWEALWELCIMPADLPDDDVVASVRGEPPPIPDGRRAPVPDRRRAPVGGENQGP
jgi:hypothetical protein